MDHTSTWLTVVCESKEASGLKTWSQLVSKGFSWRWVCKIFSYHHYTFCEKFPSTRVVLKMPFVVCQDGHCLSQLTKIGQVLRDSHFDTFFLFFFKVNGKGNVRRFKKSLITWASRGEKEKKSLIVHKWFGKSRAGFSVTGEDYWGRWSNYPVCRYLKYEKQS